MDVRHEDVLIAAALILVDREAEADGHQFVPGEAAGGRVAQHRTGVLVGVLPAELLQQDVALLHLSRLALLTLHSEGLACCTTRIIFPSIVRLLFLFTTIHAEAKQKPPNRETEIHTHNARFTSRLFATLLFLNCYFASWRRKRRDGAMRAIKNQHRQWASLVSTDGAKVWESFVPDEILRVG